MIVIVIINVISDNVISGFYKIDLMKCILYTVAYDSNLAKVWEVKEFS